LSSAPQLPRRANALFRLYVLSQLMDSLLGRELAAAGVPDGFGVYSAIGSLGRVTPKELAELVGMPPTTLSGHIERLVRQGVVRRVENPTDGRSYLLELTDEGLKAFRAGGAVLRDALAVLDRHLDRPADEVLDALEALDGALRRALDDSTRS
jgi:DNA-binding MarR family transcriptional regulator